MSNDDLPSGWELLAEMRGVSLDEIPKDVGAADILAEETGKPIEAFEPPDGIEHPHPDEVEKVPIEEASSDE